MTAETLAAAMDAAKRSGASSVDGSESNSLVTVARSKRVERKFAVDNEDEDLSMMPNRVQIRSETRLSPSAA